MLLSRAEDRTKAQGVSSEGDKEEVTSTWLSMRDVADKSPTPAARAQFVGELNAAASECIGRAR